MLPYFSQFKLAEVQPKDYPLTRRYEHQHGIMIRFKVGGAFGFFNIIFCCVMLAAAFTTIEMASTITDCVVIYLHPRRHNFFHLKYEVSADFGGMWMCPDCGFKNELEQTTCRGVPSWMGPGETPECGTPRPLVTAMWSHARAEDRLSRWQAEEADDVAGVEPAGGLAAGGSSEARVTTAPRPQLNLALPAAAPPSPAGSADSSPQVTPGRTCLKKRGSPRKTRTQSVSFEAALRQEAEEGASAQGGAPEQPAAEEAASGTPPPGEHQPSPRSEGSPPRAPAGAS